MDIPQVGGQAELVQRRQPELVRELLVEHLFQEQLPAARSAEGLAASMRTPTSADSSSARQQSSGRPESNTQSNTWCCRDANPFSSLEELPPKSSVWAAVHVRMA